MIVSALFAVFGQVRHEFVYRADRPHASVTVAGTFNGWNREATPMAVGPDGKTWRTYVGLEPGKIAYKFVLDGATWITDPENPRTESDGGGNTNSIFTLLPADYAAPAKLGDGVIAASALRHRQALPDLNYDRGRLTFRIRTRPNDVRAISLILGSRSTLPMRCIASDDLYATYEAALPWDRKSEIRYSFVLNDGKGALSFGPDGGYTLSPTSFKAFEPPKWAERSIIYQIFPDRFANGDASNDPADVQPWTAKPTWFNRFGGDVAGVRQHEEYLSGLGVSLVYFNPIFKSPSNHRYETSDYKLVDPQFGTNKEFFSLVSELRRRGIRVVLDGVFNHTAVDFAPFADILENNQKSRYLNWYTIRSFPVKVQEKPPYEAWFGFPSMPKLNVMNPDTTAYLMGVLDFWARNSEIAGWRLDVANEVPMPFWRTFRTHLKSIKPDAWILGEEWGNASAWLGGDQWDSVMNYPFRFATVNFLGPKGDGKATSYLHALMSNYSNYAPQVSRNLMNLLGSHDTSRILTELGGNVQAAMLAAVVQFTWVGIPSIYYGDELGMEGGADPENRRGMEWQRATSANSMLAHYRRLAAMRNASELLKSGDPVPLAADDAKGVVAFARTDGRQSAIVAINKSGSFQQIDIAIPSGSEKLVDAMSGETFTISTERKLRLTLPAKGFLVLLPPREGSRVVSAVRGVSAAARPFALSTVR